MSVCLVSSAPNPRAIKTNVYKCGPVLGWTGFTVVGFEYFPCSVDTAKMEIVRFCFWIAVLFLGNCLLLLEYATLGTGIKVNDVKDKPSGTDLECDTDDPLGLISGSVADWQITASSTYPSSWAAGCAERNARLYRSRGLAWCAKFKSSSEWIQVDLGVEAKVTGIMTQGRGDGQEWVTSYMVSYSDDAANWKYITDQYGSQRIFEGNSDSFSVKHNYLDEPITARYVKVHTYTWHNHPSLRLEFIGCQPCKRLLGIPPYARFAASTSRGLRSQRNCVPEYGHYLSNKAWCPKRQNVKQWLQIDVGPPTKITGVILKGRGDYTRSQYVTRFKLSYSNDSRLWYFYKDASPLDPRVFEGNSEHFMERVHYLASPFIARYVRVHPVSWRIRIAMRVGLIGCRSKGPCSTGFFRINNASSCVGNLAYKKNAWITPDNSNLYKRNLPDAVNVSPKAPNSPVPAYPSQQVNGAGLNTLSANQQLQRQPIPMMAYHRIGDQSGLSSTSLFTNGRWHSQGSTHESLSSTSNTADPIASLAVDGWTGEEDQVTDNTKVNNVSRNSNLKTRSSTDRLMSDDPSVNYVLPTDDTRVGQQEFPFHKRPACTVLHYRWPFVELPAWYVDLRDQTEINGIVIYTASHGRDSQFRASEHDKLVGVSDNLERLSVFVESEPRRRGHPTSTSLLCGFITRVNNAIYQPRLHIPCRQTLTGRYVHVEVRGVRGRWSQEFSAFLCEVMIY